MSARAPVVAVGAIVVAPGPRVLLVQRRDPPLAGKLSLPGGKVLPGETLAAAVEREVLEETGLRVIAGPLVEVVELIREGFHYVIHDHLCARAEARDEPRAGDDATAVRWAAPSELAALGVNEATVRVIARAIAMRQTAGEDEE